MGNIIYNIIYVFFGIVLLCSCNTIKLPHDTYKNLGESYKIENINTGNCDVYKYYHKFLKTKELNGKFCIKKSIGLLCAEFSNGILNGKYFIYNNDTKKKILREEGNYNNGLLDGVNYEYFQTFTSQMQKEVQITYKKTYQSGYVNGYVKIYENDRLVRKATYKNSVKDGFEYYFSEDEDTLDVVHYVYDPDYESLNRVKDIKINFYKPTGKGIIDDFSISHQYIEGKFFTESGASYISDLFSFTPLSLVKFDCDFLISYKKRPYFIFVIVGNGNPFYDLYLIYPYTVMRLGYGLAPY